MDRAPDQRVAVVGLALERERAPLDGRQRGQSAHLRTDARRRQMIQLHMHSNAGCSLGERSE